MDFHWSSNSKTCFTPLESQIARSMYFQNINMGGKWYGNYLMAQELQRIINSPYM